MSEGEKVLLYFGILTFTFATINLILYYLYLKLKWNELLLNHYYEIKKDKKKLNKLKEDFIEKYENEFLFSIPIMFIPAINIISALILGYENFRILTELIDNENFKNISRTYKFFLKIPKKILNRITKGYNEI